MNSIDKLYCTVQIKDFKHVRSSQDNLSTDIAIREFFCLSTKIKYRPTKMCVKLENRDKHCHRRLIVFIGVNAFLQSWGLSLVHYALI